MRILVTGGAGFVGSHLARLFRSEEKAEVVVLDNLRRRGSELNLPELKALGISFVHGDIRNPSDLAELGNFDLFLEASAEPSVHAGTTGSPDYLLDTNLQGSIHCLNFARRHAGAMIFLSTSRVYSLRALADLPLENQGERLALKGTGPGFGAAGIREDFPTNTARSLYGASKLCSEILLQEYVHSYKMRALVNRCGVIAGAGQFGKVDQGVFTMWIANHFFGKPLQYTGFGGEGHQVRDLLHPRDLFALLQRQITKIDSVNGETYNVGGGLEISTSLAEWTALARAQTGSEVEIRRVPGTAAVDIPYYVTDYFKARDAFNWQPSIAPAAIAQDIAHWLKKNEACLRPLFA